MARNIATKFTVEGDGEYKNAIKGIDGELKTLKSEMALASSALKNQQASMETLTAKGEVLARQYEQQAQKVQVMRSAQENAAKVSETLAQKAEEYRRKIVETEGALKKLESATGNTAQEQADLLAELENSARELKKIESAQQNAAKSTDAWAQSANYAEAALNRLSGEIAENNQEIQKLDGTSDKAEESLHKIGESAEKSGESINQMGTQTSGALDAMAGALVAAGVQKSFEEIMTVIEECTAASKEFNKGMSETFTLLPGLSSEMKEQMSGDLLALKSDMAIVGKDGTDALYQAVSAGVSAGKSMEFMETAQKAAVGGVTTLTTAVDGLTSVTNAYGVENVNTQQAADLMFTAVKLGKTNFEQLSGSLYNVIPIAANNKIAFEDITAAIAAMTAQGIPTAQSTTQLRQLLVELTDSGSEVAKTFEKVAGTSFKQFIAQGGNTQQVMQKLFDEAKNTGVGVNELFSSVEAGGAAMALSGSNAKRFATNIDAMKDSAGACGVAYDEMSSTADFASQKMEAAAEVFKISIGDVMEPQLKKMNEAGAEAFEWAAKFVEENPWVVAAVEALAATLGFLAITLAGLAIINSIVIPAIKALDMALAASPWGIVAIAVGTLITAIGTLAATWPEATNAAKEAGDVAEASAERLRTVAEETQNSADAADNTAEVCKKLAERLRELEDAGLSTTAAQKEYADIIAELNSLMPELNLEIDEQTGLLKENSKSLINNIDAMKDKAKAKVYMEQYTAALEEQAKAEMELEKFRKESGEQLDEMAKSLERYTELEKTLSGDVSSFSVDEIVAMNSEYQQLGDTLAQNAFETATLVEAQDTLTNSIATTKDAVTETYDAYDEYNQKIEESKEAAEASVSAAEAVSTAYAGVNEEVLKLCTAYDEAYQSALDSFNGQFGIFDTATADSEAYMNATVENAQIALESQLVYWTGYQANVAELKNLSAEDLGVTQQSYDALMQNVTDGSAEAAGLAANMVKAINDGNTQAVTDLANTAGAVQTKKDEMAKTVADWATNFSTQMDAIEKRMQDAVNGMKLDTEAKASATSTINSYINNIRNGKEGAVSAAQEVARAVTAALSTTATVTVNVTGTETTGKYAKGTRGAAPGLAVVGEDGPELVNFKGGEVVYTAPETKRILSDAGEFSIASISGMHEISKRISEFNIRMGEIDTRMNATLARANQPVMDYQNSLSSAMDSYYRGIEMVRRSQVNNYDSRKTTYAYGDTYIVDGITYDDGSNVASAVKSIVRAARVERRR